MFWDSDARLVRAILAGDTAAWQKFILQYSNFIYRAIVRYTDDYDEKMAVYLHVLEKLREDRFERLRRFAFQAKLSTWLTVVARRLALDFLRARYGRDFSLKKIRVVSIDGEPDYREAPRRHWQLRKPSWRRERAAGTAAAAGERPARGPGQAGRPGAPGRAAGLFPGDEDQGGRPAAPAARGLQVRRPHPEKDPGRDGRRSRGSAAARSPTRWRGKPMNDHIAGEVLAAYVDGALDARAAGPRSRPISPAAPSAARRWPRSSKCSGSREKIPAEFLRRALDDAAAESPARPPPPRPAAMPARLVFGIAAVFLVAALHRIFFPRPRPHGAGAGRRKSAAAAGRAPRKSTAARCRTAVPGRRDREGSGAQRSLPARKARAAEANGLKMEKKSLAEEANPARLPLPGREGGGARCLAGEGRAGAGGRG